MSEIEDYIGTSSRPIIYACSSQYNALLAFLFILLYGNPDISYVLMFSPSKTIVEAFERISLGMNRYGIKNVVIDKKTMLHRALGISNLHNNIIMKKVFKAMNIKVGEFFLVNFSWTSRIVRYPASIYFKKCDSAIFVEEGATQYVTPSQNYFVLLLKKIYGNQLDFWGDEKIKDVFVHNPDKYSHLPLSAKQFSIDDIFRNLTCSQREKVMEVFGGGINAKNLESALEKVDGIIFTQPLSEDGYITEGSKKKIYDEIVSYYSKYGNIVVKIHPRDNTIYEFETASILPREFPSELLNILGKKFSFAVALCSSAVETVNARQRINLNEKFLSDLIYTFKEIEK